MGQESSYDRQTTSCPTVAKSKRRRMHQSCIIRIPLSPSLSILYCTIILLLILNLFIRTSHAFMIDKIENKMIRPFTLIPKSHIYIERRRHQILSLQRMKPNTALEMSSDNESNEDRAKEQRSNNNNNMNKKDSEIVQKMNENDAAAEYVKNGKSSTDDDITSQKINEAKQKEQTAELLRRITQLEALAGSQAVELRKLREECNELREAASAFTQVVDLLRQAGLSVDQATQHKQQSTDSNKSSGTRKDESNGMNEPTIKEVEYIDESEIFGSAPSSVTDAADAAGASILAALLGGKQKMLIDVRDAELTRDPDVLVQFIELAILPVAAGLEGLKTQKNRVKIVFPTVSQLMQYRKTMALAAPEVVSLSTLGFDPVERRDNLVVIIAPSPDDEEGLLQMNELLTSDTIKQPVVILNHHMVPLSGPGGNYEPIYHLRLLTVQYMAGSEMLQGMAEKVDTREDKEKSLLPQTNSTGSDATKTTNDGSDKQYPEKEDAALAAAMEHAHELGVHSGVTRAMVIRAYPKPWHVFVDTSPDTDADFEVAATFDEYPSPEDINYAIVECLEGSEREDELVAQQMQEAIESGQLNSISEMLGLSSVDKTTGQENQEDEDDDFYNDWDPWFGTDTV